MNFAEFYLIECIAHCTKGSINAVFYLLSSLEGSRVDPQVATDLVTSTDTSPLEHSKTGVKGSIFGVKHWYIVPPAFSFPEVSDGSENKATKNCTSRLKDGNRMWQCACT